MAVRTQFPTERMAELAAKEYLATRSDAPEHIKGEHFVIRVCAGMPDRLGLHPIEYRFEVI